MKMTMNSLKSFLYAALIATLTLSIYSFTTKAQAQAPQAVAPMGLNFAATLAGCNSVAQNTLCLFGSSTAPGVAVSIGGGTFVALNSGAPAPSAGVLSYNGRSGAVLPAANDYSFAQLSGALTAAQMPAAQKCNVTFTLSSPTTGTLTNQLSGTAQIGGCQ